MEKELQTATKIPSDGPQSILGSRVNNREREFEDVIRRARRLVDELDDEDLDIHGLRGHPIFGN
jgi:hypothetical protein